MQHQFHQGLALMCWELEEKQSEFVAHHKKEYGPKAADWQQRWSRCFTTAGIPCDDNVSEVWHSDLAEGLGSNKLLTIGRQLPVMEDYMMGKSLQDDKKKFEFAPRCNDMVHHHDTWMSARDRTEEHGMWSGIMDCVGRSTERNQVFANLLHVEQWHECCCCNCHVAAGPSDAPLLPHGSCCHKNRVLWPRPCKGRSCCAPKPWLSRGCKHCAMQASCAVFC